MSAAPDGDSPRCPCGCRLVWTADDTGWHCPHCDLPTLAQPQALMRACLGVDR